MKKNKLHLQVNLSSQTLKVLEGETLIKKYLISSALKGIGNQKNSEQTPLGWHIIRAKIGANAPVNTVFVGRRATGEIYSPELNSKFPTRDWILTRIMWLSGLEIGVNRFGNCDTMQRYIYIHGTPDKVKMGVPGSRGCIRMKNQDIIELFDMVQPSCKILITQ